MSFNLRNIWADAVLIPAEAENVCQPRYDLVDVVSGSEPAGRLLDHEQSVEDRPASRYELRFRQNLPSFQLLENTRSVWRRH